MTTEINIPTAVEANELMDEAVNKAYSDTNNLIATAIIKAAKSGVNSTTVTIPRSVSVYFFEELERIGYVVHVMGEKPNTESVAYNVNISW